MDNGLNDDFKPIKKLKNKKARQIKKSNINDNCPPNKSQAALTAKKQMRIMEPLQQTNKKKNRRKIRHKQGQNVTEIVTTDFINTRVMSLIKSSPSIENKTHISSYENSSVQDPTFSIKAVLSHKYGHFIRKRNTKSKKIKLKSFIENTRPCVFVSKSFNNVISSFNKLTFSDNQNVTMKTRKINQSAPENNASGYIANVTTKTSKANQSVVSKVKRFLEKNCVEEFTEYYSKEQVARGLENNELVKGNIRINPKFALDAYVSNKNTSLNDYYLSSVIDRNRALDGDEVVLTIKPKSEWIDGRTTCKVVYIEKEVHSRIAIGHLKLPETKHKHKRNEFAILYTRDKRLPFMRIHKKNWPADFEKSPKKYSKILFMAKILQWTTPKYALGEILEILGPEGDLKVEELSILKEYGLDPFPHDPALVKDMFLPSEIDPNEFSYRKDLRKECIFTIDPLTAKDLDDALSVKELPNGNYEIGVHISDVTYFLKDGSPLDESVAKKATTIYMVNNVYHMLPREMCAHCSLLPGTDKCAFSVFWEITPNAEVLSRTFSRTVINSCVQLSYEHAQLMVDYPEREFDSDELPTIHNGFTYKDLSRPISILHKIAVQLRENRIRNGTLKIDQVSLLFRLDPKTGEPISFRVHENKEAHRLIEEFMLLANISVAEKINEDFPDIAFLRCHAPPNQSMMLKLQNKLEVYGIFIDISSAGKINSSLQQYVTDDPAGRDRSAVLYHLFSKPMTRARYFCAFEQEESLSFSHFALSVPLYTHFTSPIRRYADIMVHRLLAASLAYSEKPSWDIDYVANIAANCNGKKYEAKRAGDASSELYLAHYVEKHQPFIQDAVVVDVRDKSFDAIVLDTGSIVRIYSNTLPSDSKWKAEPIQTENKDDQKTPDMKMYTVSITFAKTDEYPKSTLVIELFTHIKVLLTRKDNTYRLNALLMRPV